MIAIALPATPVALVFLLRTGLFTRTPLVGADCSVIFMATVWAVVLTLGIKTFIEWRAGESGNSRQQEACIEKGQS